MPALLTTHSAYSLLEGLALPAELAQAAAQAGMPALGLADHHLLTGTVEFASACKAAGVRPILGLEIDLSWEARPGGLVPRGQRLALLAMDAEGWTSLCRLSSLLQMREAKENGIPESGAPCPPALLAKFSQ